MSKINFSTLWNRHPLNLPQPDNFPCLTKTGEIYFKNQCAIKMSIALSGAGLNLNKCPKRRCWFGHTNHIIAAEELATWLSLPSVLGKPRKFSKSTDTGLNSALLQVAFKRGIVFFKDFYASDNNLPNVVNGDHIDVWNGTMMSGANYYPNERDAVAYMQDKVNYFNRAPYVWFWEISQ